MNEDRKDLNVKDSDVVESRDGVPGSFIRTVTINPPRYDKSSYPCKRPIVEPIQQQEEWEDEPIEVCACPRRDFRPSFGSSRYGS